MVRACMAAMLVAGFFGAPAGASALDAASSSPLSREQYVAQLNQLQAAAERCRASASACEAADAAQDVSVAAGADGPGFPVRRDWLRAAFAEAKTGKDAERSELMAKVETRLNADRAEIAAPEATSVSTGEARTKADTILARTEFRAVEQNSYLAQKVALLMMAINVLIDRAFAGMPHSPWVALAVEWMLLGGAAVGLLIWAWRTTRRQQLTLASPSADRLAVWQKESDDWARRADQEAAGGNWREAVHCLYWAAIVMLEGKKMWRPNRARTPREYLPLLESGSPRQQALRGLTRIFERLWYGLRPARRADFEQAQTLLEELKAA